MTPHHHNYLYSHMFLDLGPTICETLSYFTGKPSHIYSIVKVGDTILYSDWHEGIIDAVSMTTGDSVDVVEGLMRPSQFYVKFDRKIGEIHLLKET